MKVWNLFKWFLFKWDAETVHHLSLLFIRLGIQFGNVPIRIVSGNWERKLPIPDEATVFGLKFCSKVGLAAGFDKNADVILSLPAFGFGFAEIGTVTPRPQAGNPRPRLFRDPAQNALFNRMGFNGLGATLVADRLRRSREKLPPRFRVGVNVGKNKDTPLDESVRDYVRATQAFEGLADYLVINVSSPNTPGLRSLQSVEALSPIVSEVKDVLLKWKTRTPLLLKLAPEVEGADLQIIMEKLEACGIDGWILTNTLAGTYLSDRNEFQGGWSGQPLLQSAKKRLREARCMTQKPIISVGGIMSLEEAQSRISDGADLIQIYTGWIYGGPRFPRKLTQNL